MAKLYINPNIDTYIADLTKLFTKVVRNFF